MTNFYATLEYPRIDVSYQLTLTGTYVSAHAKLVMHIFQYSVKFTYNPWYISFETRRQHHYRWAVDPDDHFASYHRIGNPELPPLLMITPVPRSTRARPVLELPKHGVPVYLNNVNSPGLLHSSEFIIQSPSFVALAIS